ncbi:MAG: phosphotyrosine protein phosphatase [Pseudomonadota bacterium]
MKRLLFLCSQNKLRSPTAEAVFCNHAGWEVRSAGLNTGAEVEVSAEDIEWAEYIFVMEPAHTRKLKTKFRRAIKQQKIICLGIPDDYPYMDPALVQLFEKRVPGLVG